MACVCLEVCCSANGDDKYPVPTTIKIVRIFADEREAAREFPEDQAIKAESEFLGQDIYYLLWKTDEPLNIDRCIIGDNSISNVGMWLPDSERIYTDVSDMGVELVPPQRIKARAKARELAEKKKQKTKPRRETVVEYEDGEERPYYQTSSRIGSASGGNAIGRGTQGTPWRKAY